MCNNWCIEFAKVTPTILNTQSKILEVGSRDVNGTIRSELLEYSDEYIGVDLFEGPGVDLVCNVESLTDNFPNNSFDLVASTEMLEHCKDWQEALYQMVSVLKQDGLLLLTTRSPGFELHDYPADYWRFSYDDFEKIFTPLGDLIKIENDMTLGWSCGIGILVRVKKKKKELIAWKSWLDGLQVYSMAEETKQSNRDIESFVVFDQYSRYHACADVLCHAGYKKGAQVLDVGSGFDCLFGSFVNEHDVTYIDPLIIPQNDDRYICGDIFSTDLDSQQFQFVTAVDVYEHVPPESRKAFIERLSSLAKDCIILAFPSAENPLALETDQFVNEQYKAVFGKEYPWLKEHFEYGLPSLTHTCDSLKKLGWDCQTVGHGNAKWLQEFLGFVISVWDIQELNEVVLTASEKFNKELAPYDFTSSYYRDFLIATRSELPNYHVQKSEDFNRLNKQFKSIVSFAKNVYYSKSLRLLGLKSLTIQELNSKIDSVSKWGKDLQKNVKERDDVINKLSKTVSGCSVSIEEMSRDVSERDGVINELTKTVSGCRVSIEEMNRNVSDRDGVINELTKTVSVSSLTIDDLSKITLKLDAVIENLHKTASERDVLILDLQNTISDRDTLTVTMDNTISERDALIEKLNITLSGSSISIEALNDSVSELNAFIKEQSKTVTERDTLISNLSGSVSERDALIVDLSGSVSERDALIVDLSGSVSERDALIVDLSGSVSERDALIVDLSGSVSERDALIVDLSESVIERDDLIRDLSRSITDRDTLIIDLSKTVSERDLLIEDLRKTALECMNSLVGMNKTVSQRDATIEDLNKTVFEYDAHVQDIAEKYKHMTAAFTEKQTELMNMSDWANIMRIERETKKLTPIFKVKSVLRRWSSSIRRYLAVSILGSSYRYLRDVKRRKANMVSLETIKDSLNGSNGKLIIVFPIITWDFRWQRPQHIVTRLRDQGYSVLYLAMSLSPLERLFRGVDEAGSLVSFNELEANIQQVWLHSVNQLNIYTDTIDGDDKYNISLGLEAVLKELKLSSVSYLLQFPGWWPVAEVLKKQFGGKVIFDCMDDHGGFSTNTSQALETEADLIKRADMVITSSALLENRCKKNNSNTIQVKNGTEYEHFSNAEKNDLLDHLADVPIVGYYGAISDWFDMEIISYCARKRPDWNFVLIGSTFGADLAPIDRLSNVHLLGEKPYSDLPGYLAYFDVCTIPFKIIPLTLATNPVKFYEYLSAGKPVVSVSLPELVPYEEYCYLAKNEKSFLSCLDRALLEIGDKDKIDSRVRLAKENSWDVRVQDILNAI